jgi:hypothetical protein
MADKQQAVLTNASLCKAKRKDGEPCGAYSLHGSAFCFSHDPTKAKERALARRRGGQARHGRKVGQAGGLAARLESRQFRTLADMTALLEIAVRQTLELENSISRNRCLGYLARCWVNLYEAGELEERVKVLEKQILRGET